MARPALGVPSGGNSDIVRGILNMVLDIVPVLDVNFQAQPEAPLKSLGAPQYLLRQDFLAVALFTFGAG